MKKSKVLSLNSLHIHPWIKNSSIQRVVDVQLKKHVVSFSGLTASSEVPNQKSIVIEKPLAGTENSGVSLSWCE